MLKTIYPTQASKLGAIATTYRAGSTNIYSTCPSTCSLLPKKDAGAQTLDINYLEIEKYAVPRKGVAWSYTHFPPNERFKGGPTTLNISTDTIEDAVMARTLGFPTVFAASFTDTAFPRRIDGIRFIRCPAEIHNHVTCQTCGGGRPLCARAERDYVVVFVAHGSGKKHVGTGNGGCYAAQGPSRWQWDSTAAGIGPTTWDETQDPDRLTAWVNSLPPSTLLRHRITGDLGLDNAPKRHIIPITLRY